jgi:hypothetical protein
VTARRSHQQQVEALLRELDERRRDLYRRSVSGVQRAGLADLKRDLLEVRRRLGDVVALSGDAMTVR